MFKETYLPFYQLDDQKFLIYIEVIFGLSTPNKVHYLNNPNHEVQLAVFILHGFMSFGDKLLSLEPSSGGLTRQSLFLDLDTLEYSLLG